MLDVSIRSFTPCLINHFSINGMAGEKRRKFPVLFNYEFYDVI